MRLFEIKFLFILNFILFTYSIDQHKDILDSNSKKYYFKNTARIKMLERIFNKDEYDFRMNYKSIFDEILSNKTDNESIDKKRISPQIFIRKILNNYNNKSRVNNAIRLLCLDLDKSFDKDLDITDQNTYYNFNFFSVIDQNIKHHDNDIIKVAFYTFREVYTLWAKSKSIELLNNKLYSEEIDNYNNNYNKRNEEEENDSEEESLDYLNKDNSSKTTFKIENICNLKYFDYKDPSNYFIVNENNNKNIYIELINRKEDNKRNVNSFETSNEDILGFKFLVLNDNEKEDKANTKDEKTSLLDIIKNKNFSIKFIKKNNFDHLIEFYDYIVIPEYSHKPSSYNENNILINMKLSLEVIKNINKIYIKSHLNLVSNTFNIYYSLYYLEDVLSINNMNNSKDVMHYEILFSINNFTKALNKSTDNLHSLITNSYKNLFSDIKNNQYNSNTLNINKLYDTLNSKIDLKYYVYEHCKDSTIMSINDMPVMLNNSSDYVLLHTISYLCFYNNAIILLEEILSKKLNILDKHNTIEEINSTILNTSNKFYHNLLISSQSQNIINTNTLITSISTNVDARNNESLLYTYKNINLESHLSTANNIKFKFLLYLRESTIILKNAIKYYNLFDVITNNYPNDLESGKFYLYKYLTNISPHIKNILNITTNRKINILYDVAHREADKNIDFSYRFEKLNDNLYLLEKFTNIIDNLARDNNYVLTKKLKVIRSLFYNFYYNNTVEDFINLDQIYSKYDNKVIYSDFKKNSEYVFNLKKLLGELVEVYFNNESIIKLFNNKKDDL